MPDLKLGNEFWGQAVLTAAHIHNHLPSQAHNDMAPLQYWTGKPPAVGHLRIFGAKVSVHIPKEKRQKLDPKSVAGILVGYEENTGTRVYRVYNIEKKKFLVSRDVIFDESTAQTLPKEVSNTTIGWEKESLKPAPRDEGSC